MPYPKKKYRKGYTIFGMDALIYDHLDKGRWVYLRDKVVHPSFLLNMTLITIRNFMRSHIIHEAIDQQKEYYGDKVKPYANL